MKFYRCKCGKTEGWGEYDPPLCSKCTKCESSLARNKNEHKEPENHLFMVMNVPSLTGYTIENVCQFCGRTENELKGDYVKTS